MPTKRVTLVGRTARPEPTSYEEGRQFAAEDAWDEGGDWALGDRERAAGRRDTSATDASGALERYRAGGRSAVGALPPLGNEPLTDVSRWLASVPDFAGAGAGRAAAPGRRPAALPELPGWGGGGGMPQTGRLITSGQGGGRSAYEDVDVSGIEQFDPTAYGKTFTEGAFGEFGTRLTDRLNALEQANAGTGRLKTGFYAGGDRGRVVNELGQDLNQRIAQASTVFAGQRLAALQGGASARLQRAGGIDTAAAEAARLEQSGATAAADLALRERQTGSQLALQRWQAGESAAQAADELGFRERTAADEAGFRERSAGNDFALRRWQAGAGVAQGADELAFRRQTEQNRSAFERASFLDTGAARERETALDASLGRERMYLDDYGRNADRASEYLSGSREWANADRAAADARREAQRLRKPQTQFTVGGGGAMGSGDPVDLYYSRLATQLGVPYRKYA